MTSDHNEPECSRPSPDLIKWRWIQVFSDPLVSSERLKEVALSKDGLGEVRQDGAVVLRSVYWKSFHRLLPDPTSLEAFPSCLTESRARYDALRSKWLVAPDGRWAADCTGAPDTHSTQGRSSSDRRRSTDSPRYVPDDHSSGQGAVFGVGKEVKGGGEGAWDPLSLDGNSPWKSWFAQIELRSTIRKDVERTFPDLPYFESEEVRKSLVTILFIWSMMNPDVGYRQGMHELLAVCYLVIDSDSLLPPVAAERRKEISPLASKSKEEVRDEAMYATLDRASVEHDAFALFEALMKGAKSAYEWRAEEAPRNSTAAPSAPIIQRVGHIQSELLRKIDPQLWERLETEGVEAQIWAIRWIRLIFTRELPFPLALQIWDRVLAQDASLEILDFVCIALLLLIRKELLFAGYATLLTHLLHYSAPSQTYPLSPYLIVKQATYLRDHISPAAGVEMVMKNQEVLGVRAQPPEPDDEPRRLSRPMPPGRGAPPMRGVQGLTASWIERAQAAGLDKAFLSTVSDLRRNLPDSATAYSYLPNLPFSPSYNSPRDPSGSFSTIPTATPLPHHARPSVNGPRLPGIDPQPVVPSSSSTDSFTSAKTVKDAELEMAELRLAMVGMGKAMASWLADLSGASSEERSKVAYTGLERIRDTLLSASGKETDDIVREWAWSEGLVASRDSTPALEADLPEEVDRGDHMALKPTQSRSPRMPPVDQKQKQEDATTPVQSTASSQLDGQHHYPSPLNLGSSSSLSPVSAGPSRSPQPGGPSLYLSNRDDRPVTSLTRTPMAAPHSSTSTPGMASPRQTPTIPAFVSAPQSPPPRPPRQSHSTDRRQGTDERSLETASTEGAGTRRVASGSRSARDSAAGVITTEPDPLAGIGVNVPAHRSTSGSTRRDLGRQQSLRKAGSSDPLGAGGG